MPPTMMAVSITLNSVKSLQAQLRDDDAGVGEAGTLQQPAEDEAEQDPERQQRGSGDGKLMGVVCPVCRLRRTDTSRPGSRS